LLGSCDDGVDVLQALKTGLSPSNTPASLARAFSRLGWIGFWVQIGLGTMPILLMIYTLLFTGSATSGRVLLIEALTIASLMIMGFTTIWSFYYTRLAKRIADPLRRPVKIFVERKAWIGVAASTFGIVFSLLLMLAETALLLSYFLRAPQAGVPVIQTAGAGQVSWVSAMDIVSLLTLILVTLGDLVVLIFSLWLLFRSALASAEPANSEGAP